MKYSFKSYLSVSCIFPLVCFSYEMRPDTATLRHIESAGVGYDYGYTTLHTFFTQNPQEKSYVPFLDLRGHILDNGTWAANGGLGVRKIVKNRIWGINGFYDYRGTNHLNYNQVSLGFETLGSFFDARINTYIPCGKKFTDGYNSKFGYFQNNFMHIAQKHEYAMTGLDAEAGFNIGTCSAWRYYTALGPYFFHGSIGPNAWGGKVRLKASYKQYFSIELIESYDNVFHNRLQGQIYFSIPFGKKYKEKKSKKNKPNKLNCRFYDPVQRNEIIVLNKSYQYPLAKDPLTGSPYQFIFVNNLSSSKGTFESPYPSLLQAENNSHPGQVIYVFPGDGTTNNMDQGITLKNFQKLWGSSIAHPLETQSGNILIPSLSAIQPKITNITGLPATILSNNNEISGITYIQTPQQAIFGANTSAISIDNCNFPNCVTTLSSSFPVEITSLGPLKATIFNNSFTNNSNSGVHFYLGNGVSNAEITFSNNTASLNQSTTAFSTILHVNAFDVVDSCKLNVSNNIIENNNAGSILISSSGAGIIENLNAIISSNIITNNSQAITFQVNCTNLSITALDNVITQNDTNGIGILKASNAATKIPNLYGLFSGNKINQNLGPDPSGIQIDGANNKATLIVKNNELIGNRASGFAYSDVTPSNAAVDILLQNNNIEGNLLAGVNSRGGFSIDGFKNLKLIAEGNTLANNNQGSGIGGYGMSILTLPENVAVSFKNNMMTGLESFYVQYYGNNPNSCCVLYEGNTAEAPNSYYYQQNGLGTCLIAPLNYSSINTGTFSFLNTITPAPNCSGLNCNLQNN